MMRRCRFRFASKLYLRGFQIFLLALLMWSSTLGSTGWHHPLYVSGGDYWRQRIRVDITNSSDRRLAGKQLQLQVGSNPGEVDLAGVAVKSVRVVDGSGTGTELLFALLGPDGESLSGEVVTEHSSLAIPVECQPYSSAVYWIYFDNPTAWPVPDFLRSPGLANGGVEQGAGSTPTWWKHDSGDPDHQASWVEEAPYSGQKCLKLQVTPGAPNSWISTRQNQIPIEGGRTYTLRGWVRAQDVSPGRFGRLVHPRRHPSECSCH